MKCPSCNNDSLVEVKAPIFRWSGRIMAQEGPVLRIRTVCGICDYWGERTEPFPDPLPESAVTEKQVATIKPDIIKGYDVYNKFGSTIADGHREDIEAMDDYVSERLEELRLQDEGAKKSANAPRRMPPMLSDEFLLVFTNPNTEERFQELAKAYHQETGGEAPGTSIVYDYADGGLRERERGRQVAWRNWLDDRMRAAHEWLLEVDE